MEVNLGTTNHLNYPLEKATFPVTYSIMYRDSLFPSGYYLHVMFAYCRIPENLLYTRSRSSRLNQFIAPRPRHTSVPSSYEIEFLFNSDHAMRPIHVGRLCYSKDDKTLRNTSGRSRILSIDVIGRRRGSQGVTDHAVLYRICQRPMNRINWQTNQSYTIRAWTSSRRSTVEIEREVVSNISNTSIKRCRECLLFQQLRKTCQT
jgi:hypothetical protein